jgi:hypothetical protein
MPVSGNKNHCVFEDERLEVERFKEWVLKKDQYTARCKVCRQDLPLGVYGRACAEIASFKSGAQEMSIGNCADNWNGLLQYTRNNHVNHRGNCAKSVPQGIPERALVLRVGK